MEGKDPDKGKAKMEEEASGQPQNEKGKKKLREESDRQSQNDEDKKRRREEPDGKSEIEKGKKNLEEEDAKSQNSDSDKEKLGKGGGSETESDSYGGMVDLGFGRRCQYRYTAPEEMDLDPETESSDPSTEEIDGVEPSFDTNPCYFCEEMCFSWRTYVLHVESDHRDHPWHTITVTVEGEPTAGFYKCFYCTMAFRRKVELLYHLRVNHPENSYGGISPEASDNESVNIREDDNQASQSSQSDHAELPTDDQAPKSDNSVPPSGNQASSSGTKSDHGKFPSGNQEPKSGEGST